MIVIYLSGIFLTILLGLLICYIKPETVKLQRDKYDDFGVLTAIVVIIWPFGLLWFISYLLSLLVDYIIELGMKRKKCTK